jgi:hypothetical protein
MCVLVARQYAAQGMWDVSGLQHSNDIADARNVQETIEKIMHVRKMCEGVSSTTAPPGFHGANYCLLDLETLESIFAGKMRYTALAALVELEFGLRTWSRRDSLQ